MDITLAIIGNPNVGKTEVFNALTGLSQTTGNYPGVTVERKHGRLSLNGHGADLIDLPGTYSLAARSPDEMIVADVLLGQQQGEQAIDAILVVADASNLERNLYLVSQVLELGKPTLIALNMMDLAEKKQLAIDVDGLSAEMGVAVVPIRAHKRVGIDRLKAAVFEAADPVPAKQGPVLPLQFTAQVEALEDILAEREGQLGRRVPWMEALRVLADRGGYSEQRLTDALGPGFSETLETLRDRAQTNGSLATEEATYRYRWAESVLRGCVQRPATAGRTSTDVIDGYLTHKFFGSVVFVAVMLTVFQSIYSWAAPLMDSIDAAFGALGGFVAGVVPQGVLQSLLVDGVIAGIGSVIIFLPQILVLSLFIALLEDCGYMARAAFLMDKLFSWCGLSGQSFIPMLSSFACAIPGIMATRTIENRRDRLVTMLVAPLMSCSARLPVYVIMIAAFVPSRPVLGGVMNLQGLSLFLMYTIGIVVALPMAWLLKNTILKAETPPFVLELPSYKTPSLRTVLQKVYLQGKEFLRRAGTTIFAITIIVWALAYFPRAQSVTDRFDEQRAEAAASGNARAVAETLSQIDMGEARAHLENSALGRLGHVIEPVVRPLGWDWRIGTGVLASFPAREIIVATLGTIFNIGAGQDETSEGLRGALKTATWPDGRPLFNLPVAISVMVFFALCSQCGATLVMLKRETGMWRWPVFTFAYMTLLAYVGAFVAYRGALWLGWGGA